MNKQVSKEPRISIVNYPAKVEDFKYQKSIGELSKVRTNSLTAEIIKIMVTNLDLNLKGKAIQTEAQMMAIANDLIHRSGNLELQEINFIFNSGVKGLFGPIYSNITIDTILGKDGWIEAYYKEYRKLRPDPEHKENFEMVGNEMTMTEYHEKYPESKNQFELCFVFDNAKNHRFTMADAKQFYLIKGFTEEEFEDDTQMFKDAFNQQTNIESESTYITECFRRFTLTNAFKKPRPQIEDNK